ncbi:serine hydrolase domain-containing protein [Pedobacter sp. Du54]|uniref:serine hydrolase domain-containing protein n=1 Tax=Pedobacter anseongensis TaxID=3133439 RepID=UPI00309DBE13
MKIFLNKKLKNLLVLTSFIVVLAACSKKDDIGPGTNPPTATLSSAKEITNVNIFKSDNPNLTGDGYVYRSGVKLYITIPLGSDLSAVKVIFNVSAKANVKIDGLTLSNNTATLDLTKTINATVSAEDGSATAYTILAQLGIKDMDAMIYPFIEKYGIPAASYAIGKNSLESIVYKNASGFSRTETKERATPNHLFRLASMTKQHTAIAIMNLIQQGKIGINDLVFGPTGLLKASFPVVGQLSAKVTVKHLLEHTGGYTGDPMFSAANVGQSLDQRIQVMLNSAQSEPGTKYYYYNMGYGVLGKVIEVVSGKDYETYLKEMYASIGITRLRLATATAANIPSDEAVCYPQGNSTAYGNDMNVMKAAAGVAVTTEDLFKILYAVDGGTLKPDILSTATRTLMFTPSDAFSGYAKGWRTNHTLFSGFYHGGNLAGTGTFWIYGTEYSVAVLLNSRNNDDAFDADLIVLTNNLMKKAKELGL